MGTMTREEINEAIERAPYTYAEVMQHMLGDDWEIVAGWRWMVTTKRIGNRVTIDAKKFEITWMDLAPDGEPREQRTIKMPTYASLGATVAIAEALAELSNRE